MRVPIVVIVGEFGSGKSLLARYLAEEFILKHPDKNLITNMTMYDIEYIPLKIEDLAKSPFPDYIRNGLLILDEIQSGTDAYDFMKSGVRRATKFISQIRKYDLELIMITPRLDNINKRLREITNYIVTMQETNIKGVVSGNWYFINNYAVDMRPKWLSSFRLDLTEYFEKYDTKQIIGE